MRRMLVALLDTVKESPATLAAVDRFMRDEVRRSWIYLTTGCSQKGGM